MQESLQYSHDNRDAVLERASSLVLAGQVLVFPSDTVYALLAAHDNAAAYRTIFEIKQRDPSQKIAILAGPSHPVVTEVMKLLGSYEEEQDAFLAGELTAVFPAARLRSVGRELALIQPGSLGVRLPAWEPLCELIEMCGGLLWGTSANLSGSEPPVSAADMLATLPALSPSPALCVTIEQDLPGKVSDVVEFGPDGPHILR